MPPSAPLRKTRSNLVMRSLAASASIVLPVACFACPVCFAAEQRQLWAYFGTAVLLSVLPFVLFGGLLLWIRMERRRHELSSGHGAQAAKTGLHPERAVMLDPS
ncbi:MAG: hypothetical protein KatS3mg077_3171 [Candidatus Binatia bacterium]|nr:MAG: hypothetical protein KatS3mg077_3171 [Candidatus Binatia bacterium]